jgi:predicted RNase H-like HicB family nuclease
MKLMALLHPEADGGYSVRIPAMPGCHSQGDTLDEAIANIREAAELWIEVQLERAAREAKQESPDAQLQEIEL